MVIRLFREGALSNVSSVEVEPEWGYTTRLRYRSGAIRITYGNDIGLNAGAATELARDKAYTKLFFKNIGAHAPEGSAFLFPWWAEQMSPAKRPATVRTTESATEYACDELGLPVYVKPVDGSKGIGVSRCETRADVTAALAELAELRTRLALVEKAVDLPDYRLVLLNGELISAYRRTALSVTGDGKLSVRALIDRLAAEFRASGRDTRIASGDQRIARHLRHLGLSLDSVPQKGETLLLLDISNLSAGGTAEDVTSEVAQHWRDFLSTVAEEFGLNFCGIDLLCGDITDAAATYSLLELNSAPGLDHYAFVGESQAQVVRELYAKVLNVPPARGRHG
jgi:D-alanine-D-alanine ligase-like ATP-grasp enzyme